MVSCTTVDVHLCWTKSPVLDLFRAPLVATSQVEKVTFGRSDGVELQLAGGGTLRARRAVITVPLGVLKAGDVAFEPPLPDRKAAAIASLGFGALDKV